MNESIIRDLIKYMDVEDNAAIQYIQTEHRMKLGLFWGIQERQPGSGNRVWSGRYNGRACTSGGGARVRSWCRYCTGGLWYTADRRQSGSQGSGDLHWVIEFEWTMILTF